MKKYSIPDLKTCDLKAFSADDLFSLNQRLSLWCNNGVAILRAFGDVTTPYGNHHGLDEDRYLNAKNGDGSLARADIAGQEIGRAHV